MTEVSGCHAVPSFQGTCPNQQIVERDGRASCGRLSANLAYQLCRTICDGVDWHGCFQFIEESPATFSSLGSVRAVDPMRQFGNGNRTESGFHFTDLLNDQLEELRDVEMLPFGLDNNAGVENYSQAGGFHG